MSLWALFCFAFVVDVSMFFDGEERLSGHAAIDEKYVVIEASVMHVCVCVCARARVCLSND